jgi:hypothetical protein
MKWCRKAGVAFFILTVLMLVSSAFLTRATQAKFTRPVAADFQTIPLAGDMSFKVYPDHSIKAKVIGSLEQVSLGEPPPIYGVFYDVALSPSGTDLTMVEGNAIIKMSPAQSVLLSTLDLDIVVHSEDMAGDMSILFKLPGYLELNGSIVGSSDEATKETTLSFDLTTTIWYTVVPEGSIQEFIQTFPTMKTQLTSQIYEMTEGNITLQELTLVTGKLGTISATIALTGRISGDFQKGMIALSTKMGTGVTAPKITPEELIYASMKSFDLHVTFDKEELALIMDTESIIEGDIDKQLNTVKNIILGGILQSQQTPPEATLLINNLLYPTEISVKDFNANFEYSFEGDALKSSFLIDGIRFKPPTTKAFLTILNQALTGVSLPRFTLTLEGTSDENEFVEIEVPPSISDPISIDRRKVVWTVDNLTNLNLVTFNVREWPKPSLTLNQTEVNKGDTVKITGVLTIEGEPVTGQAVNILANNVVIGTIETDNAGGFSYTHRFENTGSYEVKTSLEYYEKNVESQATSLTVKSPSIIPQELVVPLIGGAIIVIVAAGVVLMKRGKPKPNPL